MKKKHPEKIHEKLFRLNVNNGEFEVALEELDIKDESLFTPEVMESQKLKTHADNLQKGLEMMEVALARSEEEKNAALNLSWWNRIPSFQTKRALWRQK